eukprot:scaffold185347_cov45-Prasinocladus_malaysianus.AAC.3
MRRLALHEWSSPDVVSSGLCKRWHNGDGGGCGARRCRDGVAPNVESLMIKGRRIESIEMRPIIIKVLMT